MRDYFSVSEEFGITRKELSAVQAIVMAVAAGKVNAQSLDARASMKKEKNK
jgi:hypothetical protein